MKTLKHITTLLIILLFTIPSMAQNGINYKAIIKDGSGNILPNTPITVQFSILQSALLINVYTESHTPTTDANGLIIVNIGEGTIISGDYATIDWSRALHFLNVQIDTGSGLVDMGNSEFKTVPYALNSFTTNDHYWEKTGGVLFNASEKIGIGTVTPTGKTEISYSSTTLDPTLTLTQEIDGSDPFARINFRNNINSNYWAIAARSELTPANNQFNIWNGTNDILSISGDGNVGINGRITINNPSSYGLKINSVVDNGIIINTPSIYGISMGTVGDTGINILEATLGSGYYIGTAGLNGLTVNVATNNGVGINSAGLHGVFVSSAGVNGFQVDSVGNDGVRLGTIGNIGVNIDSTADEGIYIGSAGTTGVLVQETINGSGFRVVNAGVHGLQVTSSGDDGIKIVSAGKNGVFIDNAVFDGLYVNTAGDDGVHVASATNNGGKFRGANSGVHVESSIDINPDLILGASADTATGDDGIITSDPDYTSSDIRIKSNDAVVIHLDQDDDEAGNFQIKNGAGTTIFDIAERGDVYFNMQNNVFSNGFTINRLEPNAITLFNIDIGGNALLAGTLTENSDRRLKKDIEDLPYGLTEILLLQPKAYYWKNKEQNYKSLGLIAQEVQPIIKEIVKAQKNEQKTLGISYTQLIPILINAIKEQQDIIDTQDSEIKSLQSSVISQQSEFDNRLIQIEAFLFNKNETIELVQNK